LQSQWVYEKILPTNFLLLSRGDKVVRFLDELLALPYFVINLLSLEKNAAIARRLEM
jgi:hypothetical protein